MCVHSKAGNPFAIDHSIYINCIEQADIDVTAVASLSELHYSIDIVNGVKIDPYCD